MSTIGQRRGRGSQLIELSRLFGDAVLEIPECRRQIRDTEESAESQRDACAYAPAPVHAIHDTSQSFGTPGRLSGAHREDVRRPAVEDLAQSRYRTKRRQADRVLLSRIGRLTEVHEPHT